jgi:predicted DNA-binding WGR domain protein
MSHHLRLVDPPKNRFRSYSMTEQRTLFGDVDLVITWGRIGWRQRSRVETFSSVEHLDKRRDELLNRRRLHGYEVVG